MIDYMNCMEFPVVVGEWSLATTDCARWLDGFGVEPNAPKYGVSCPDPIDDSFLTQYASAQLNTFERGLGWIFWCLKTDNYSEDSVKWDMMKAVENGWLPSDFSGELPTNVQTACDDDDQSSYWY
eukprot:TRINITY_DN8738_c0_g1_i2.p1 TRINITY_DN8738_c0_g1~~TRINITY_DN8738_c0_g1_i2.p1  ORF type:complete len:125 (-),score=38.56 TRINITY_DN8738_c0_g1_i2:86-460(-)